MNLKFKEKNSSIKSRKLLKMNLFLISGIVLNNQIFTGCGGETGCCKENNNNNNNGNGNNNNDPNKTSLLKSPTIIPPSKDKITSEYDSKVSEENKSHTTTNQYFSNPLNHNPLKTELESMPNTKSDIFKSKDTIDPEDLKRKKEEEDLKRKKKEAKEREEIDNKLKEFKENEIKDKVNTLKSNINGYLEDLEFVELHNDDIEYNNYKDKLNSLINDDSALREIAENGNYDNFYNIKNDIVTFVFKRKTEMQSKIEEMQKDINDLYNRNNKLDNETKVKSIYDKSDIIYRFNIKSKEFKYKEFSKVKNAIDSVLLKIKKAEKKLLYKSLKGKIDDYKKAYSDSDGYEEFNNLFSEILKELEEQYNNNNNYLTNFEKNYITQLDNDLRELRKNCQKFLKEQSNICKNKLKKMLDEYNSNEKYIKLTYPMCDFRNFTLSHNDVQVSIHSFVNSTMIFPSYTDYKYNISCIDSITSWYETYMKAAMLNKNKENKTDASAPLPAGNKSNKTDI